MNKIKNNMDVVNILIQKAKCKNRSEYARYLEVKYDKKVIHQSLSQFAHSEGLTVVHMMIREALESA